MRELAIVVSNDNTTVTPFETIDAIAAAGFRKIFLQWYNRPWEITQEQQLAYARRKGLTVIFAHLGYKGLNAIWAAGDEGEQLTEGYLRDLDVMRDNGIDHVVMHLNGKLEAPPYGPVGLERFQRIVDRAAQNGICISFENTKLKGYHKYLLDRLHGDNFGMCLDGGHLHCHFSDDWCFDRFAGRITAVHLHDNDGRDDLHLLPFDGTVNWPWLMKTLRIAGYAGPVTLECCYHRQYPAQMSAGAYYREAYARGQRLVALLDGE